METIDVKYSAFLDGGSLSWNTFIYFTTTQCLVSWVTLLKMTKTADFYDVVALVEINVTNTKFCREFVGMIELSKLLMLLPQERNNVDFLSVFNVDRYLYLSCQWFTFDDEINLLSSDNRSIFTPYKRSLWTNQHSQRFIKPNFISVALAIWHKLIRICMIWTMQYKCSIIMNSKGNMS